MGFENPLRLILPDQEEVISYEDRPDLLIYRNEMQAFVMRKGASIDHYDIEEYPQEWANHNLDIFDQAVDELLHEDGTLFEKWEMGDSALGGPEETKQHIVDSILARMNRIRSERDSHTPAIEEAA